MNYQLKQETSARNTLAQPESYAALRVINDAEIIFRIWRYPSLSVCSAWLLYKLKEDFFVRRLEWDWTKDNLYITDSEPTIYGSETNIPEDQAERVIEKLKSLKLQPFQISDLTYIDGTTYGIEARFENLRFLPSRNFPLKFSWHCKPPDGWESLESWLSETASIFDSILPVSTAKMIEEKFRY